MFFFLGLGSIFLRESGLDRRPAWFENGSGTSIWAEGRVFFFLRVGLGFFFFFQIFIFSFVTFCFLILKFVF